MKVLVYCSRILTVLAYEIDTEDFYKDINPDVERLFDTSNYPEDHESGIKVGINKKVPGLFKDEAGGKQILAFVGLRAKLYSYRMKDYEEKKCKGVKKAVVRKSIKFEDYKKCLLDGQAIHRTMISSGVINTKYILNESTK